MKLELKHISPYLPYGLILWDNVTQSKFDLDCENISNVLEDSLNLNTIKPILRPFSDLTKEIEVNGEKFVPMNKLLMGVGYNYPQECYDQDKAWVLNEAYRALGELPHRKVQKLFEWHFDIFGLIEIGLAIDINSLVELNGSVNSH